jgi:pimeloyl-ACP methyl ester carboxylesterase
MHRNRLKLLGLMLCGAASGVIAMSSAVFSPATSATPAPTTAGPDADSCSALVGRQLGGATIDKVDRIAAGAPTSLFGTKAAVEICKVSAHANPAAGSEIKFHVWLPVSWNGKMLGFGGGGFNGSLTIDGLVLTKPVNDGYAALSTDAGHDVGEGAKWALGHPEKIVDFGHRANHVGTVAAKAIIEAYYGSATKHAYFHGCSNGGRDALMLAQRYPEDYDGIIAGAPANSWTALMSSFARNGLVTRLSPAVDTLAPKLTMVRDAAIKQCDAADGVKDGLISNPAACRFDPRVLQCKSGASSTCLSKPEATALRGIYQGTRTRDGQVIMPGFPPGSELEWPAWFTAPDGQAQGMAQEFFRNMVYDDPNWDRTNFVLDRDYPAAKRRMASILDATDTDLRPLARRGGKLLMYHGWDDPAIPAGNSIRYFEAARRKLGRRADQARLFMVPGMAHCGGGTGPNGLDMLAALDSWVQTGKAPERLTATRYEDSKLAFVGLATKVLATRPICAWPNTPHYKGSGSKDDESSFACR